MLSSSLAYAYERRLPSGQTRLDVWKGQVLDITSEQLTGPASKQFTMSGPQALVTVPDGQQATCLFTFGMLTITVPYTVRLILICGPSSCNVTLTSEHSGVYDISTSTDLVTNIQFSAVGALRKRTIGESTCIRLTDSL